MSVDDDIIRSMMATHASTNAIVGTSNDIRAGILKAVEELERMEKLYPPFYTSFEQSEHNLYGMQVVVTPDSPRMRLSPEVCEYLSPSVIKETNAWMIEFFGVDNIVQDGAVIMANGKFHMNPRTYMRHVQGMGIQDRPQAQVINLADYRR